MRKPLFSFLLGVLCLTAMGTVYKHGVGLSDITEFSVTSPANGQRLNYNGSQWVNISPTNHLTLALTNQTDSIVTGTHLTFRAPFAMTVVDVRASIQTAPTGANAIFDINEGGTSILSTKLSIDATEKTSTTAASAAVISDSAIADDAEITVDVDQVGSTVAGVGPIVTIYYTRP